MKALNLSLSEGHVCYCSEYMSAQTANLYFSVIRDVSNSIKGKNLLPADVVLFSISPDALLSIFQGLGQRDEFTYASIHAAMKEALISQLQVLASSSDTEDAASAGYVLQQLQVMAKNAGEVVENKINIGRNFLSQ